MKLAPLQLSLVAACAAGLLVSLGLAPARSAPSAPAFESAFASVAVRSCVSCHNASDPKGGLDLTRPEGLAKGGDSGPVLAVGKPEESLLFRRVRDGEMPPGKGKRLAPAEVAAMGTWIKNGAVWTLGRVLSPFELTTDHRAGYDWWSLRPVTLPHVPPLPTGWGRGPIDAFVGAQLRAKGLRPAPEADRVTYIRRATYDLLGLPPTPTEIDAFVADRSPQAYEKLIDRLLASPHYGERWGRHWLDVARFGESDGYEQDRLRDHAWQYRDYVIRAFNEDKPYPQFIREQLAGDVLPTVTRDSITATGFLVAGPWDEIQNVAASKLERTRAHEEQLEELVGTVSQAFLGLTVNCARCHDHKFDPIPQTDYYRLKAVFDGVEHGNRSLLTPAEQKAHDAEIAPLQARVQDLTSALAALQPAKGGDPVLDRIDASTLVEGRFGKALDARQGVVATRGRTEFFRAPLTVECWARVDSRAGFNILVANNPKESSEHWELYTYAGSGEFSVYMPGFEPAEVKSGVPIADGRWHSVAMVFDGARVKLHVDGKLARETPVIRRASGGALGLLYIGAYPPHKIPCDGVVDEVRISRVAREINGIPTAPLPEDGDTLALWRLDEGKNPAGAASPEAQKQQIEALQAQLKAAQAELAAHAAPMAYCGTRRQPEPTVLYLRGDVKKPGPQVTPGGLSTVRTVSADFGLAATAPEGERRLKFADWLAQPENPLTTRVLVNRVWQYHFGQGLVDTPSDFGFNGSRPSHPELLDWLAGRFAGQGLRDRVLGVGGNQGSGSNSTAQHANTSKLRSPGSVAPIPYPLSPKPWSVKDLHREIMLSAAYRQSSRYDAKAAAVDADNRLLWHFAPRRLEAETVRDAMLAVSGELNPQVGGPSFRPFTVTIFNTSFYHLFDSGEPEYNRRTLYRMGIQTGKSPFLDALDCPAPSLTIPRRRTTTTALQALALMNDSFVQRQARKLAERLPRAAGATPEAQVALAYRLAFGRPPTAEEQRDTARLVREQGLETACWALLNASEFLYVR